MSWREIFAMLNVAAMLAVASGFGFWLASLLAHPYVGGRMGGQH
jgi:hypothetical protein